MDDVVDDVNPRRLIGGVNEVDGKYVAVIQIHHRCHGELHRSCLLYQEWRSDPLNTVDEAIQKVAEVAQIAVDLYGLSGRN